MQILRKEDLIPVPWKNGGGMTREVQRKDGPNQWLWRISIADVDESGPFSRFEGLARILTVFHGEGMELHHALGVLTARPLIPVGFSGETPINGHLLKGAVRDLNVIFDPTCITAKVWVVQGPQTLMPDGDTLAVLCLTGPMTADATAMATEDVAIGTEGHVTVDEGGMGLAVRLSEH